MYHQTSNNPSYLTQPIISDSSSPSPTLNQFSPTAQSNPTKQHAFGSDSEHENSDSEEDSAGFHVYKDHTSNARYSHLPVTGRPSISSQNPLNRPQNFPSSNRNTSSLLPRANYNYPPQDHSSYPSSKPPHSPSNPAQEFVPMPSLGSEWNKNESKNDKDWEGKDTFIDKNKWNQRKEKVLTRKSHVSNHFRDFLAGRRNLGGWFNRFMALGLLIFCVILGALLSFFLVPRIPTLAYDNQTPLTGDSTNGLSFDSLDPPKFNFNGNINLAMTANSYVKPKVSQLRVIVDDLSSTTSAVPVATGSPDNYISIDTKGYTPFSVPLKFSYSSRSKTDPVWTSWHEACRHKWPGQSARPNLQLGIIVEFSIVGRIGSFSERVIFNNVTCPVELPSNAA